MLLAGMALVAVAAVTLGLGVLRAPDDLTLVYASIGCCVVAGGLLIAAFRRRTRHTAQPGAADAGSWSQSDQWYAPGPRDHTEEPAAHDS